MANPIKVITTYVRSSLAELKKVTWPTKEKTMRYSMLVIVVSLAVAMFFATLDFGFSRAITYVLSQGQRQAAPPVEEPVIPDLEPVDVDVETVGDENGGITIGEGDVELEPSFEDLPADDFDLPPL
jgi:preprotein translocase subunit SecE